MRNSKEICSGLSDAEIIDRSLQDLHYFGCLYDRYETRMLRYIRKISGLSREEAEDILQEAFIRIWTHIHDFQQDLAFHSWLYRIVHNLTISQWRKNTSRLKNQEQIQKEYFSPPESGDMQELGLTNAQVDQIQRAVSSLKENYREIIVLRFFENLSYEEISDILKIPEGTVATRINRAKKQLHEQLGGLSFFE
jgi:RNA polymerase sigma-70 factor (ECF subfamily)